MQVHETQSDIRSGGGGVHGERERKSERRTLEGTSTIAKRGRRRGAEQSRTEMGNRQKVRGWLHTFVERTSENTNVLGIFTLSTSSAAAIGGDQERVCCEKRPPSLHARTYALNNEFNYKWRSEPPLSPLPRSPSCLTAALHREPDWQRPPPRPPNDL